MMNIGISFYYTGKLDSSLKYFFSAKNLDIANENKEDLYNCLTIIGDIYYKKRDFSKSLDYHFLARDVIYYLNKNSKLAETYYSIGCVYNAVSKYDKAIDYYLQAKTLIEDENGIYNAMILHAMGIVYEELQNYRKALNLNLRSYQYLMSSNDLNIKISCLNSLGSIYQKIGLLDSALFYIKIAQNLSETFYDRQTVATTYNTYGNILMAMNKNLNAINIEKIAYQLSIKSEDKWRMAKVLIDLGRIYLKERYYDKADFCFKKGLRISKRIEAKNLIIDAFNELAKLNVILRNYREASRYQLKFIELQDRIKIENSHRIAEMQLRYETDKREKENEILRRSNSIQHLQIEKQTLVQTIQLLFLIVFAALSGFLLFRYHINMKVNRGLQREIDATMEREREQQQIIIHQAGLTSLGEMAASIIHDVLQPIQNIRLTAESVAIRVIDKPADQTTILSMMDEIKEDVLRTEKIVNHIRIFARKEKQTEYDKFYVNDAIQDALMITRRQFKSQKISIETNLSENLPLLIGNHHNFEQLMINLLFNARDAIYQRRTQNPTLTGEIKIGTTFCENEIRMFLSDNGVGIPDHIKVNIFKPFFTTKKAGIGTGLGLVIVRKMIKEMNGKIDYHSIVDEGTTVVVGIPVSGEPKLSERMPA